LRRVFYYLYIMKKHSLEISTILAIIIIILLSSCGTRQAETIKRDSISINNTYSQGSKIVLGNTFTYKPFDNLKPMVIEGKEYKNAIVSNDKSTIIEKWKTRNINKTIVIEKVKKTEKSDNTILWIGVTFVVCLFIFLYFYLPKIKV